MKNISQIAKEAKEQALAKLQKSSKSALVQKAESFELSVYSGELTGDGIGKSIKKVMDAYPKLPKGFYDVFAERIEANNFNDERLLAAVNHVVDNHRFPTPSIAEFISYDKRIELFNFKQMQEMTNTDQKAFERHVTVRIHGVSKPMWTSRENVELYNLELWEMKI